MFILSQSTLLLILQIAAVLIAAADLILLWRDRRRPRPRSGPATRLPEMAPTQSTSRSVARPTCERSSVQADEDLSTRSRAGGSPEDGA